MDSLSKWQAVVLPEMLTIVRAAEILLVLEGIYGSETEAAEDTEGEKIPEEKDRSPVGGDTNGWDYQADSPNP